MNAKTPDEALDAAWELFAMAWHASTDEEHETFLASSCNDPDLESFYDAASEWLGQPDEPAAVVEPSPSPALADAPAALPAPAPDVHQEAEASPPAPASTPAERDKLTMPDRRRAVITRANANGLHDLAEELEKAYGGRIREAEKELDRIEAEKAAKAA
jgi:hypothetical protein